ncbi:hypothetical protein GWN63_03235 [Candidatus Bathyarchaeota archaeon]|nr:hypothetical protein [Candidatus Bathyarchaeota archaeon]NIR17555.1 hypothetical protein [Desulfobacterales bacterium]NIU81243.1 hypothetical protein [Candidatus Bathyarchaeota archaeon]NIV67893.1 hypothetical protein [Candidatus Bathyarchaeota archaeon]NIW16337.1 hypothetical protein [Candidatus Bathyarchaeota archaeon]
MPRGEERCKNPWNGDCDNTEIEVYIYRDGRKLPICQSCWAQIANLNVEW